jgi:hypothetical protein
LISARDSRLGVPQARIGEVIGISDNTLRKHYRRELTCGMTEANTAVARNLCLEAYRRP